MASILEREQAARGVQSLRQSDCMEIVENLLRRLKELDQELAARNSDEAMARIESPSERARDRILSDEEIRVMFRACEGQGVFGSFVKMLLFTAQRRTKVATMQWEDLAGEVWTIATEDREKGNAQRLKLPKPALAIIDAQREMRTNGYVFPASFKTSRADPSRHYGSFSAFGDGKAALDKGMAEIVPNIPRWTLHDLRRTARSLMSRARVRPEIAERVLGHAIPGVQGVYDRHAYDLERAQALTALAALIGRILDRKSGNVVPLRRA
ncbi:hypothetical protein BSZ22_31625 [Bradyrhizobium canariense]|uniref:Tyr recombinase domain-containing protein n=1 Tax=Bradyrhizobium canariense TaxID=255045 RepID=A0A1X3FGL9_9BRAD|nr:hypothetical protein BSZ22_31625 [Bradyrhizobium canariense]OSI75772.1 hypothetical protein BSZ23_27015 [Bradyrhizobium canariense]OSI85528.1 hypothetical protein BSZ24_31145 [Bradyrhizobium canariense]OSI87105.1 hypothetical protein BSZ25_28555 [Bradyrhizobium canariense]OSI99545.1 hypothetical protein BSZ16_29605 [Bradyrhizobium canariense]